MKTPSKLTLSLLFTIFVMHKVSSQSSSVGHIGITPALSWCGYTNNALPFHLEHRGTQRINFLTGGVNRMTILGTSSGATAGFVGIGTIAAPSQKFEVEAGNINLFTGSRLISGDKLYLNKK